jgi:putative salt-induced outer membrane protein YdiY
VNRLRLPLCALIIFCATPAAADQLRLTTGDRFTGQTVSLSGGTLTFTTAYGSVQVPWTEAISLTIDQPVLVTIGTNAPVQVTITAAGDGQATLQPGGTVPLAQITALSRPQPAIIMDGGANAGYITTGGNTDVNSLRLDGDVVARTAANRYTANAALIRAKDRGIETARTWTTALKYDRFLTPRLFLNASTSLTNDPFRDLDLRTALGAGVGYQVLDTGRVTLTADAGLGYVNENFASQADDSYAAARESAALNAALVPDRVEFFHLHDAYVGVTGDDNLFVKMQNGVRFALVAGFVMTLRHDLDYDQSPAIGRESSDRAFALALGYRF